MLAVLCVAPAFAADLTINGTGSGTSGGSANTSSSGTGYSVQNTANFAGYRFTYLNSAGGWKGSVDIIASASWSDYTNGRSTTTDKYNKKDLVDLYNSAPTKITLALTNTSSSTAIKDTGTYQLNYSVTGASSNIQSWKSNSNNVDRVLDKISSSYSVDSMSANEQILIEPIVLCKVMGKNYALTLTEIWTIAGSNFGYSAAANWGGDTGTYNNIAYRLNGTFPDNFYVNETNSVCAKASELGVPSSPNNKKGPTFSKLITQGYGLHIIKKEVTRHTLTVNYYSNYATEAFDDALNTVGASKNVLVRTHKFYSDTAYPDGLHNYTKSSNATYLGRTGYVATGYWNTQANGSGKGAHEDDSFASGIALANAFGKDISNSDATVNVYAQWEENSPIYKITCDKQDGANGCDAGDSTGGTDVYYEKYNTGYYSNSGATSEIYKIDIPTRPGYKFGGYWTGENGTGTRVVNTTGSVLTSSTFFTKDTTVYAYWVSEGYTVTYNANGGSGAPASQTKVHDENLTLSTVKPTRSGYTFTGWNTSSTGLGTNYAPGGTYSKNADVTLYAQWEKETYTISYDANGGSGAPSSQTKEPNKSVTLRTTEPTRTGYEFIGWNTDKNGNGTSYEPGDTYSENASVTLYAQWAAKIITITCNKQSGSGGTDVFYEKYEAGYYSNAAATAKITKITTPTRTGYTFGGYYTATGGSGTQVVDADGKIVTSNTYFTKDTTIYAKWTANIYTIICDKQDGANGCDPGDSVGGADGFVEKYSVGYYSDAEATIKITSIEVPTREGYIFGGYYTEKNGGGTQVVNASGGITTGATYYKADTTIYAKWTAKTYTVTYNANGGTGAPDPQTKTHGHDLTLSNKVPTRTGYEFDGWNTQANGNGTSYSPGGKYSENANVTLYAQWTPSIYKITCDKQSGSGGTAAFYEKYNVGYYSDSKATTKITSIEVPTREGYIFGGYYTEKDGNGTQVVRPDGGIVTGITYYKADTTIYAKWTANKYTIVFDGNGATSGSTASMSMTFDVAKNLNANGFKRTGYVFAGWNTEADGSGTTYANKQSVVNLTTVNGGVVTLYAQWDTNSYVIAFEGNGATSGNTATMSMKFDETKNLNANGFARTGHKFVGWNTRPDNKGTAYSDKQAVKNLTSVIGGTVTLYAIWEPIEYTIVFDGNGATGGSTASMSMKYGDEKYLTTNGFTFDGCKFLNWNTKADGSGTKYNDRQSVKNLTTKDGDVITLYAQWDVRSYKIAFNGNGAPSGSTVPMTLKFGETKNLTANGFIKPGYHFVSWNTKADESGTTYTDKQAVKDLTNVAGATVTLYAQWEPNEYQIIFDGNGATGGSTESMSMTYDVAKNLTANGFVKAGYKFLGWNIEKDGSGTKYTDKQSVKNLTTKNNDVVVLYAQWVLDPMQSAFEIDYDGNGATKGEGWTEFFEFKDIEEYALSDNSGAFERTEVNVGTGSTRLFKFMGWLVGDEVYDFGVEVSCESLNNIAKTVEGRPYKVATIYAAWDEYPTINAVDRWFTLDDVQNGKVTLEELLHSAEAFDSDIGDKTLFGKGEGTFTIIDFDEEEFKKFDTSGSVTVTYQAIDKVGNETYRTITVHIVDKDSQIDDVVTRFTRFISARYFKDSEGTPIAEEKGGLSDKSIWLNDAEYNVYLTDVLGNTLKDDGTWSNGVYATFVFTKEDVVKAKQYIEEHGLGNTKEANALEGFYQAFPPKTN